MKAFLISFLIIPIFIVGQIIGWSVSFIGEFLIRFFFGMFVYVETESENVDPEKLKEELADVFAYAIMLAGRHGFDVSEIVKNKIKKNANKYPVEKSRGISDKYDSL